ncbi:hypothetical protein glysoja_045831 [Glycine soja]|uniref:Uncharacterized protein n=1 Tax=Glycine soja TaxID=3848 RepID=A0A0B2R9H6_GLYSO|nr:hypothetical protein glysoja_045831 [Glycine soja]
MSGTFAIANTSATNMLRHRSYSSLPPPRCASRTNICEEQQQKNNNEEEEEEASKLLEIENGLRLVPRVKLNLTHLAEEELKRRGATLREKGKSFVPWREGAERHDTRNVVLVPTAREYRCARSYYPVLVCSLFQLTEKLNEIELNLEGVKFKLARYYSCFGYFQGLKKDWEEHSTFRSRREPDTVVLRGMSSR